jgi:hypothetical protein
MNMQIIKNLERSEELKSWEHKIDACLPKAREFISSYSWILID